LAGGANLGHRLVSRQPVGYTRPVSPRASTRRAVAPSIVVGTDLIEVGRVSESIARFGERYISKIYTEDEATYCASNGPGSAPHFAARFAAKEATMKVLRPAPSEALGWRSIEVVRSEQGWCELRLHGAARTLARRAGLRAFAVSLSHEDRYATAVVIAELASKRGAQTTRDERNGSGTTLR
jgi:holo-[acyl-carrier protein] synthase